MTEEKKKPTDQANLNVPDAQAARSARAVQTTGDAAKLGVERCCVREFWAVVAEDGTLVRGRGVLRTLRLAAGMYEVYFTGDVSEGVFVATIGNASTGTQPSGQIGVALRCCPSLFLPFETNKGVWVDTHDSNGNYSDRAFHVMARTQ